MMTKLVPVDRPSCRDPGAVDVSTVRERPALALANVAVQAPKLAVPVAEAVSLPFAGGFTTRHYGQPRNGVHAVQIEINRALYMDEINIRKNDNFDRVAAQMTDVVAALARLTAQDLAAE